jgi:undecaprenyl-diphosphatase
MSRVSGLPSLLQNLERATPAIAAGAVTFALAGVAASRRELHPSEQEVFRAVNDLPGHVHRPVWAVMQAGSLGAAGVAAGVAALTGRRPLAVALGVSGSVVWAKAKVVKRLFGRGRPADHVATATIRGRPASGLGFPSGHAAVAMTLATVACPDIGHPARVVAFGTAAITAFGRVYVGAHLPADVVGGLGIGLAAGAFTNAVRFSLATPSR